MAKWNMGGRLVVLVKRANQESVSGEAQPRNDKVDLDQVDVEVHRGSISLS